MTVHTYPIRIRTSQRISQQSIRIKTGSDTATSAYTKISGYERPHVSGYTAYTEISGYTERIRRTRVDARCIRIKKFADTKICGYVWTGPNTGGPNSVHKLPHTCFDTVLHIMNY